MELRKGVLIFILVRGKVMESLFHYTIIIQDRQPGADFKVVCNQ